MPVQTQEKTIDGTRYRVTQLGGELASDLLFRLLKAIGAGVARASGPTAILALMAAAARSLEMADFHAFREAFVGVTTVCLQDKAKKSGVTARWMPMTTVGFDAHFQGRPGALLAWFRWCFEVNFGGFFAEALAGEASGQAEPATESSPSDSPPESDGGSGESRPATAST